MTNVMRTNALFFADGEIITMASNSTITTGRGDLATLRRVFCSVGAPFEMSVNFGNEEEVKEYIERIGIEYRFGCFSEKDPEACHLLGEYLDAIKKDYHKAGRIFKTNCDEENHPRSCHSYGNYLFTGQGVDKRNEDRASEYYLKACSLGVGTSCFNAGMLSINPTKKKEDMDYKKAVELLDKACSLQHVNACYYLSGLYITGSTDKNKAIPKDLKEAFKYSEKACDLNHLYACMNLSTMYRKGEGVEKNEEMAEKINKKVNEIKEELNSNVTLEFQRGTKPF